MIPIRQNTVRTVRFGPFIDDTDFKSLETSLTIAQANRQISKNGAARAQSDHTGNSTHDGDGYYIDDLAAGDTDTVGQLDLEIKVAGAMPVWRHFQVIEESVYDALYAANSAGFGTSFILPAGDISDRVDGQNVRFIFETKNSANQLDTLSGGTLTAYKNGDDSGITTGFVITRDFSGETGINHVDWTTTDAAYGPGDYTLVLSGGTVNSQTVGGVVASCSLENRRAKMDVDKIKGNAAAATNLFKSTSLILFGAVNDVAPAPTGFDTDLTVANDVLIGWRIGFLDGPIASDKGTITANTGGLLTITGLSAAPADTNNFVLF